MAEWPTIKWTGLRHIVAHTVMIDFKKTFLNWNYILTRQITPFEVRKRKPFNGMSKNTCL